ncbi:MAG: hypothetical protein IID40_12810 [Planctomycetes bacterium]|nr:hypothetical protein [Planctomycetota bacterium]
MNSREKKLAGGMAVVVAVGVLGKVVYPLTIKPLFDVSQQIEELEAELYEVQEEEAAFDEVLLRYKNFVARTGGTDPKQVRNRVHKQLDALLEQAALEKPGVTPRNPSRDKKTGLHTMAFGLSGEGSLAAVIDLLRQCYELPYLARFKDLKLTPATVKRSARKGNSKAAGKGAGHHGSGRVRLVATLEVMVLPGDKRAGRLLDLEALEQPTQVVKHSGESFAMIWQRDPFSEYVKRVTKPPPPKKEAKDPPKPVESKPETKPDPAPPVERGDRDARYKTVAMALKYGRDELLITNLRRRTQQYVTTGEQLDGGELIAVHPYGGIVRKDTGDYFYEVGTLLSEATLVVLADDYPEIQALSRQLRDLQLQNKPAPPEDQQPDRSKASLLPKPQRDRDANDEGGAVGQPDKKVQKPRSPSPRRTTRSAASQVKKKSIGQRPVRATSRTKPAGKGTPRKSLTKLGGKRPGAKKAPAKENDE